MFNYGNALIADTTLAIFSLFILKKYFEIFFIKKDRKIVGCFCWALYFIWQLIIGSINILPAYINVIISIILVSIVCIGVFEGNILQKFVFSVLIVDFSLFRPLEFFVDPKNGDGRNNNPPAMRVRVDCYTKKLPFRVQ